MARPVVGRSAPVCPGSEDSQEAADVEQPSVTVSFPTDQPQEALLLHHPPSEKWLRYSVYLSGIVCFQTCMANLLVTAAPYMVKEFVKNENTSIGYYAGFLLSAFFCGRAVTTTYPWGWVADTSGRKVCLFIAVVTTGVLTGLVGLTRNFWMVVFLRFLAGCFSPTLSVARALAADIVPKHKHSSTMAHISAGRTMGFLIGPTMGGWLAYPCEPGKWGSEFLKTSFPVACSTGLPFAPACITCALLQVVCLVLLAYVPESPAIVEKLHRKRDDRHRQREERRRQLERQKEDNAAVQNSSLKSPLLPLPLPTHNASTQPGSDPRADDATVNGGGSYQSGGQGHVPSPPQDAGNINNNNNELDETPVEKVVHARELRRWDEMSRGLPRWWRSLNPRRWWRRRTRATPLKMTPGLVVTVMIAFFISFARIATDQTSALFCVQPLDFRVATVGTVFFVSGLINFPLQIFLVPWLIDTFKPRVARVVGLLTAALCCLLFPSVGLLTGLVSDWVLVCMVAAYIAVKDLAYGGLGHTSNFLIVNDCLPTIRGRVNGMNIQAQSVASTFSPVIASVTFSWGLQAAHGILSGGDWLTRVVGEASYGLPFYICGLVTLVNCVLACLPASLRLDTAPPTPAPPSTTPLTLSSVTSPVVSPVQPHRKPSDLFATPPVKSCPLLQPPAHPKQPRGR